MTMIGALIIWALGLVQCLLIRGHKREMDRCEQRRHILLEQARIVNRIAIARANGDHRSAVALFQQFEEHNEALLRDFPELKPK